MSIEQKSGVISEHPGYPYSVLDIEIATGIPHSRNSSGIVRRKIDGDARLTPFTDPLTERVFLSEADFQLVIESVKEGKENSSLRTNIESATLPDDKKITAGKKLHVQQITEIVTKARELKQAFSLEQIENVLDPTPKRSSISRASARQKAVDTISAYRKKIELHGWTIDSIPLSKGSEEGTNRQFWFRRKDEPPFTPPLDTEVLAKKDILLPNGKIIKVDRDTLATIAIRRAILAQENGTHYLAIEIAALRVSPFNNPNGESNVYLVVNSVNSMLREYGSRFDGYEPEVNGRKVWAFRIMEMEEKPALTSSPEP